MVKIPLRAIPNQKTRVTIGGQNCTIHLYQRGDYLFMDIAVDGVDIRKGAICLEGNNIIAFKTPNFSGYLFFVDMTGRYGIPEYTGLNDRYKLFYAEA